MMQLLDSYLTYKNLLLADDNIINYEPFIEDGEQQYDVKIENFWVATGYEHVYVSVSDLLAFMWSKDNETR